MPTKLRYKYYVGSDSRKNRWEVFRSASAPTEKSHGDRYRAVIGPFRTKAGADVMAKYGRNNPHLLTVSEAEKMAKRLKGEKG